MNTKDKKFIIFCQTTSAITFFAGCLVLIGWIFDITVLKSVFPDMVAMKANTALNFVLLGVSLWLVVLGKISQRNLLIAQVCAFVVVIVGGLSFSEYLFGWNLGIDQLLFKEPVGAIGTSHTGRMAPITAVNFTMLGLSLIFLDVKTRHGYRIAQFLALVTAFTGLLGLIGYAFNVIGLYKIISSYTQIALHTTVIFILFSLGVLSARAHDGLMVVVTSGNAGSFIMRRILPFAIAIPVVLGWLCLEGQRLRFYDAEFGMAFFALIQITVLSIVIWVNGALLNRTDIERKRAEEEIKELNEELKRRTFELESINKELEAFSYSVSHDLRAPLRAIDGFSGIILEDYSDKFDAEGKRLLNVIINNAHKMGQLIDDLLTFSRLGRQDIRSSNIDMSELAKTVFEELKTISSDRTIELNIKTLPPACGDRAMIREVFANLLSNAVKFTRTKAPAVIEVGGTTEDEENIYCVKDNGVGFDMQYKNKLFGVFQRLHSAEEFEGTGVGLALTQQIIHRHGGRVWAEGKLNEGATFYFSLPKEGENGRFK